MYSIWQINDHQGNKLGLLQVLSIVDIIDVVQRAKNKFGDSANYDNPVYIGDID